MVESLLEITSWDLEWGKEGIRVIGQAMASIPSFYFFDGFQFRINELATSKRFRINELEFAFKNLEQFFSKQ